MSKYIINNKKGCTVTIMVPWDCDNACAFCVNKCEYNDGFDVDAAMEEILKSIKTMHAITPMCDFVITGGEPFANCMLLANIIDAIPNTHNIYINTTLPVIHKDLIFTFVRMYHERISCINISRHIWTSVDGANDKFINKIGKYVPIRINSVIPNWVSYNKKNRAMLFDFFEQYAGFNIQIRSDYRNITIDGIQHYETNPVYIFLKECGAHENWHRAETNRVGVKMTMNGYNFTWHLTCDFSKIEMGEDVELVDIIVNQNGEIRDDWNEYGAPLDLEDYRRSVNMEGK